MSGNELTTLFVTGITNGLLQGAKIIAPYIIGFCVICVIIGFIKGKFKKK